ncbi:hypothetical protein [Georgenia sp. Z1491]|uniref:hypothetical protein n=1 Tax=Georgenia sp. Z1491 TaxID=3416707 RepID=UPI003CF12EC8
MATTLGSLLMAAASVGVLFLVTTYGDATAPGANAAVSAGIAGIAYGVVRVVQDARMDKRSWYVARSDRRSMGLTAAIGVDLVQNVLLYAPPVTLTVLAAELGDRTLALTGAICAIILGVLTTSWSVRYPLPYTGLQQTSWRYRPYAPDPEFVRRSVGARLLRLPVGVPLGLAGAVTVLLVTEPRPGLVMTVTLMALVGLANGVGVLVYGRPKLRGPRRRDQELHTRMRQGPDTRMRHEHEQLRRQGRR